jgi:predicted nucleic acid-binding protein
MSHFTAVLDACVLRPLPLADLLLRAAEARLYRAQWSAQIQAEWLRSVLRDRPELDRAKLDARNAAMNRAFPTACIAEHQRLIEAVELPDANDRHVVAAAIRAKAEIIVTYNLRDFPAESLAKFELQAQHPDIFLRHLIDLKPFVIADIAQQLIAALKNPPVSAADFLNSLEKLALPESAAALRELLAES